MKRVAALFAGSLIAAALPFLTTAPAAVAASGACQSDTGVSVVVDYGALGGGTVVRCAQTSGTGLDALHAAGFPTVGTQKDGPAFVCRIGGKPDASKESCVNTPGAGGKPYWSYWIASNGGGWKYSGSAASNRRVTQGTFEGWHYGTTAAPGFTPVRAGAAGTGATANPAPDGSGAVATPPGPGSASGTALPKPKPRTASTDVPDPSAAPTEAANASDPVSDEPAGSGNSAAPWIAGGVVLALIAAAVLTQRRRRNP